MLENGFPSAPGTYEFRHADGTRESYRVEWVDYDPPRVLEVKGPWPACALDDMDGVWTRFVGPLE